MNLAIHCAGDITTIGFESGGKIQFANFPSKYLFTNPKIFSARLSSLISDKFSLTNNSYFESIVVSISGELKGTKIILSDFINRIALSDAFTGFDFGTKLKNLADQIYVINDIEAYSHGIINAGKLNTYSLLLVKDHFVGSSYIINDSFAIIDWNQLSHMNSGFNPNAFIGNIKIDDILFADIVDIKKEYTKHLSELFISIIQNQEKNSIHIKNIVFLTEEIELVDLTKLQNELPKVTFYIDKLYKPNYSIQMNGCFAYLRNKGNSDNSLESLNNFLSADFPLDYNFLLKAFELISQQKINSVIYFSEGGKELRKINSTEEFLSHFNETKPFANPNNYYLFKLNKELSLKIKLDRIIEEKFIKNFRF